VTLLSFSFDYLFAIALVLSPSLRVLTARTSRFPLFIGTTVLTLARDFSLPLVLSAPRSPLVMSGFLLFLGLVEIPVPASIQYKKSCMTCFEHRRCFGTGISLDRSPSLPIQGRSPPMVSFVSFFSNHHLRHGRVESIIQPDCPLLSSPSALSMLHSPRIKGEYLSKLGPSPPRFSAR